MEIQKAITQENYSERLAGIRPDHSLEVDGAEYEKSQYTGAGGAYSNIEIVRAIVDGHIVAYPFTSENLNGSSYDVMLGDWFWRTDAIGNQDYYQFFDTEDIKRYFQGPYKARPNAEWTEERSRKPFKGIPDDHSVIVLRPGERVLAHTHEFVGIKPPGTTSMQARSTVGRNGIVVCKDAGWGDPGYYNRWTMEIQNDNHESVALPVGFPIAQIVFYHTKEVAGSYAQSGNYHEGDRLESLVRNWRPDMMLPKARPDQVNPLPAIPLLPNQEVDPREIAQILAKRMGRDRPGTTYAAPPPEERY